MCDDLITIHEFPESILDNSELHICLAQAPPPSKDKIRNGRASELLLPFLEALYEPRIGVPSRLDQMIPSQNKCAVVLLPEFSISMHNWTELDRMIRQMTRPLIVIGGIGVTESGDLKRWKEGVGGEVGTTDRIFGFPDHEVSGVLRYNVGCCWTHTPSKGTQCVIFLKNYLERTSEAVNIDGLGEGTHLLCIRTNDTCIYPLICAEFTSRQLKGKPLDRIKSHISAGNVGGRKILIAGLSFEPDSSHSLWRQGLNESVHLHKDHDVITVIVNNALDSCSKEEVKDKWRCLSGVFTARRDSRDHEALPPSRPLRDDSDLVGVMCRTGKAQAICGKISWDLSRPGTRFLWRTIHRSLADDTGALRDCDSGDLYADEIKRFIRRYSPEVDCQGSSCRHLAICRLAKGGYFNSSIGSSCQENSVLNKWKSMEKATEQLDGDTFANAERLFDSILSGLGGSNLKPDLLTENQVHFLQKGLQVTGALKLRPSSKWQNPASGVGQIVDEVNGFQILVWADPQRRGRDIDLAVEKWTQDSLPGRPLLAIVQGFTGSCREGIVDHRDVSSKSLRRTDITASPMAEDRRGIDEHRLKKAVILALPKIEDCFEDADLVSGVERQIADGVRELGSKR